MCCSRKSTIYSAQLRNCRLFCTSRVTYVRSLNRTARRFSRCDAVVFVLAPATTASRSRTVLLAALALFFIIFARL